MRPVLPPRVVGQAPRVPFSALRPLARAFSVTAAVLTFVAGTGVVAILAKQFESWLFFKRDTQYVNENLSTLKGLHRSMALYGTASVHAKEAGK